MHSSPPLPRPLPLKVTLDFRCTEIVNYYSIAPPPSREAISFMRPLIHCGRGGFIRGRLLYQSWHIFCRNFCSDLPNTKYTAKSALHLMVERSVSLVVIFVFYFFGIQSYPSYFFVEILEMTFPTLNIQQKAYFISWWKGL